MVDGPSDALQLQNISGRNSPGGGGGGQKSLENPENLEKLSPGGGGVGVTGVGDHLGTIRHISVSIENAVRAAHAVRAVRRAVR